MQRQQGATLIVMVLLTMLMLLAVLFVTMNLSMSARRTTTDHSQTIPAQFAAESGIALAQAQLKLFRDVVPEATASADISDQTLIDNRNNIAAVSPAHKRGLNLTFNEVMTQMGQVCGTNPISNLSNYNPPISNLAFGGQTINSVSLVCQFPQGARLSGNQLNIFNTLFTNLGTTNNPLSQSLITTYNSAGLTNDELRKKFIAAMFADSATTTVGNKATATVKNGIVPIALVRGTPTAVDSRQTADVGVATTQTRYPYFLLFRPGDVDSVGKSGTAERRQVMNNTNTMYALRMEFGFFGVTQDPPVVQVGFDDFAFFVDDAANGAPLGSETFIRGRMHTNTWWQTRTMTQNNVANVGFAIDGKITSSGCTGFTTDGKRCSNTPAARIRNVTNSVNTDNPSTQGTGYGYDYVGDRNTRIRIKQGQTRDFKAAVIPLPKNANDQQANALNGGIYIPSAVSRLDMSVTTRAGAPDIQNLSFATGGTDCFLRVVPEVSNGVTNEKIQMWNGRAWVYARRNTTSTCGFTADGDGSATYNGNFAVNGEISRLTGNSLGFGNATYSTAKGQKMTITATGPIKIATSLTYANRTDSDSALGIYTPGGNIFLTQDAQSNLTLDAFVMASNGSFELENLFGANAKGSLNHYGGRILKNGGNGVYTTDGRGYSGDRQYLYDDRKVRPRGFPTYTEEKVPGPVTATGNPLLINLTTGFHVSGDFSAPNTGTFENNGEIRQVGM